MRSGAQAVKKRGRGVKAGLDLQRIVAAARQFEPGALSMQSIADALQVDRKALHNYVKDRETLLSLVALDAFFGGFADADLAVAKEWTQACRLYAHAFVRAVVGLGALAEHLWFGETELGDWSTDTSEALFKHLADAGFRDADAIRLVVLLTTTCLGHARDVIQFQLDNSRMRPRQRQLKRLLEDVDAAHYPNLVRVSELGLDTYGPEQLEFSINLLIEGAMRLLPRG